ncbi:hypothetical protein Tco_1171725 [Tanacetum coccineum]
MGRDTIQLENAVSTISQEYLLEFTSEYGIPEGLHPGLPGLEDTIVDFPEGKFGVYTKFFEFVNFRIPISQFLFDILGHYQIHLSQLSVIGAAKASHFKIRCRVLNISPTLPLFRRVFPTVVDWRASAPKDGMPTAESYSAADVAVLDTHHEVSREIPSEENPTTTGVVPKLEKKVAVIGPRVNKRHRKRASDEADVNAPPKVLRKDHVAAHPEQSTHWGKSLASIGLEAGTTCVTPATQEALLGAKSVSDPDPLSYARPQPHPERDMAQASFRVSSNLNDGDETSLQLFDFTVHNFHWLFPKVEFVINT